MSARAHSPDYSMIRNPAYICPISLNSTTDSTTLRIFLQE